MKYALTTILAGILIFGYSCKSDSSDAVDPNTNTDTAFIRTITFPSLDSLTVTADHYHVDKTKPIIVLCHQAGWSRGEYQEIAPKLNALGFNCIATDQRSGGQVNGITNQTNQEAVNAGKPTAFLDAEQDIIAAIKWAKEYYGKDVILWGSSYSSALALKVAKENDEVEQVLAFSPGEYLPGVDLKATITGLDKPSFLTSSKTEEGQTKALFEVISAAKKTQFVPNGSGEHGSRALWEEKTDHAEYWTALKTFLGV
jgi:dienelactone hydrolase